MKNLTKTLAAAMLALPIAASAAVITFTAHLTGDQVVPRTGSEAYGDATVALDTELFTVTTDYSWFNLSGPGDRAHIHNDPPGQALGTANPKFQHQVLQGGNFSNFPNNPMLVECAYSGGNLLNDNDKTYCVTQTGSVRDVLQLSADDGYFIDSTLTFADLISQFRDGKMFLDMHTEEFGGDEIRGQFTS